jgi:predicted RNA-binding Zn-ribbon protein involved in translation (DUF1610 family)
MNKYKEALSRMYSNLHIHSEYFVTDKCDDDYDILCELIDKATPKKVIVNGIREGRKVNTVSYTCPSCNNHIGRDNFCKYCGQAISWSKEEKL